MKYCNIILVLLLLNSCQVVDKFGPYTSYSTVTYVKNTLDYPVLAQCYFRPVNDNNFWCENELVEYSEPIEIQPNENIIVMDYVMPSGIKIFRVSDNTLLFENFDTKDDIVRSSSGALIYSSEDAKKLGTFTSKQIVPKNWSEVFYDGYYIQNERYLCENINWSLYPIYLEQFQCSENLIEEFDNKRKNVYKEITDGYALVHCIVFDKNAECFAQ
jgi:hypothetical protein